MLSPKVSRVNVNIKGHGHYTLLWHFQAQIMAAPAVRVQILGLAQLVFSTHSTEV